MEEDDGNGKIKRQASAWGDNFAWEAIEALGQGVTVVGADGRFEYVNPTFAQMIGRSSEELVGLSPFDITHPDDHTILRGAKQRRWTGEPSTYVTRLLRPDGTVVHAHISGVPRWEGDKVIGSYTIITDLTKQKLAEKELQESQAQLAGLIASAMDAIISVDKDQNIVLFNAASEEMFGCSAAEALGQPLDRFIPERFQAAHRRHIQRFGQTGMTGRKMGHLGTLWALRADGQEFPIEASISQAKTAGRTLYTVILRDITEKLQAEEMLRESEQRFRALIENALDGIVIFGSSGRIEYASPVTSAMMGYSPDEIANTDPAQATHPNDLPGLLIVLTELLQTPGKNITTQYRMRHKDGSWLWLESNISNFSHIPGIEGLVFNYRDITGRKQAEEALRQSEARYQAIVEDQTDLIMRSQADGTILFVNEAYARTFSTTPAALVGQNFLSLLGQAERKIVRAKLNRLTPANPVEVDEHQTSLPDGRILWLRWTDRGIFADDGRLLEMQAVGYDITERREAEEKLLQSETQLQHIIDAVPEGVLLLATDGSVRLTNPVAGRFLKILAPGWEGSRLTRLGNWPLNELLTSPPRGLWHEISLEQHAFAAIARPVEHGPENSGWVLVLRDVTQEREIQQRAQQQDRLAAVGQLAAGIAHDFNNIMAVITLYAQLLLRKVEMPAEAQEKLNTIERQAHRATDLIQQILDFSRQSVLDRQPLDLLPFMKELVKLLERTLPEHIQLRLDYREAEYLIQADPSRIQQVMMNLAVNARDAMPKGGRLRVSLATVQTEKSKPLPVGDMPPGKWIQIEVSDSGSGIPPQALPQIFEPFFTTKEVGRGTGLGLAQVYGIVQQHEGYIDVVTRVKQGTTFSLYFPALDAVETAPVTLDTPSLQEGQGQLVLVVEDNPAIRQALVGSLGFMNYEVIEAINGREALTILETKASDIDLVLSDVVMPEMGGIALLHAMRQRKLEIPVVLLTGHPLGREMENLQALGLAGWLPKPPTLVNLSNLLAQVLAP